MSCFKKVVILFCPPPPLKKNLWNWYHQYVRVFDRVQICLQHTLDIPGLPTMPNILQFIAQYIGSRLHAGASKEADHVL